MTKAEQVQIKFNFFYTCNVQTLLWQLVVQANSKKDKYQPNFYHAAILGIKKVKYEDVKT